MFKRPQYIAFAIVVLLTLLLLNLPSRTAAQLKAAISGLSLPFYAVADSTKELAAKAGDAITPRAQLLRQIEQLQSENDQLRMQAMQMEEAARENQRLHRLLAMPNPQRWNLKMARVVARDPANWWRNIKIDLGLRDGITTNAPVLTPDGLVGRVSEPGYTQSRVVLVGDPDCRVHVVVEGTNAHTGMIAPTSSAPLDTTIVDLGYLSRASQLKPGQKIHTTGQGGVFPPGILVGSIIDFRVVDFGLYSEARVKLAVNMNQLEEVWVIAP